jgi:hypothetical protein
LKAEDQGGTFQKMLNLIPTAWEPKISFRIGGQNLYWRCLRSELWGGGGQGVENICTSIRRTYTIRRVIICINRQILLEGEYISLGHVAQIGDMTDVPADDHAVHSLRALCPLWSTYTT